MCSSVHLFASPGLDPCKRLLLSGGLPTRASPARCLLRPRSCASQRLQWRRLLLLCKAPSTGSSRYPTLCMLHASSSDLKLGRARPAAAQEKWTLLAVEVRRFAELSCSAASQLQPPLAGAPTAAPTIGTVYGGPVLATELAQSIWCAGCPHCVAFVCKWVLGGSMASQARSFSPYDGTLGTSTGACALSRLQLPNPPVHPSPDPLGPPLLRRKHTSYRQRSARC